MILDISEVRMALNRYEQDARNLAALAGRAEIKPERADLDKRFPDRLILAKHILWMVEDLRGWLRLGRKEELTDKKSHKLMRWVCWIQGALCGAQIGTIQQGRVTNYRILNDGQDPPND